MSLPPAVWDWICEPGSLDVRETDLKIISEGLDGFPLKAQSRILLNTHQATHGPLLITTALTLLPNALN